MSRKTIGKFSLAFQLALWIAGLYHRLYYRRFTVVNREKIPSNNPVIFAANHQNALMDALAVIFAARRQIVFMARADIFQKKIIANILYFLKILPVYRIRDGFHSVDQNKDVFREVFQILENNRSVALFPEGNHLGEKRLRTLKKGAARMAMQAEEANDFNLGVSIVPVGIYYSNYYNAGSDILINFGDPIPAAKYREEYRENSARALSLMTDDLADGLRKVMLDIGPEEDYKVIHDAVKMYAPVELKKKNLKDTHVNRFLAEKELVENFTAKKKGGESLRNDLESYQAHLLSCGIRDDQVRMGIGQRAKSIVSSVISLALFPIHLYGMILNYLPFGLPIYLARNIKDRHFLSSIRFGQGLLLFLTWYVLLAILSFCIFDPVFLGLAFILSLPVTGLFAFYYYRNLLKIRGDWRWLRLKYRDRKEFEGIIKQRERIIDEIGSLLDKSYEL